MKPLQGVLVIAVEQAVAVPLCTARLADAGARVIKIERPEGDFARGYDRAANGDSSYFVWTNQGKESVVLDFKTPEGAAQLERLIAKADVLVQNLAPGAMERAGFGSEALRERHPRLITCDLTGYGDSEAMRGMKAYDFLVQAESGMVNISGGPGEMGRIGVSICDIGAGVTAHGAIVEALLLRERTGRGAGLALSLFDVAAEWMTVPLIHQDHGDGGPTRQGWRHPSIAPYGSYETGDGSQTIVSIQNGRGWRRFCAEVLNLPGLAEDPRFASNNARVGNRDAMDEEILAVTRSLTAEEFRTRLLRAAIAFGGLNSLEEVSRHPALRRRTVTTSAGRSLDIPAPPVRWSGEEGGQAAKAPAVGEQTEAVLAELDEDGA